MGATMQMQYQDPEYDPIPSFMLTNELEALPTVWEPFWHTEVGLILAIGIPTIFFIIFGFLMFQARLAGAFVAIMTLAMLGAWYNMAYDMQPVHRRLQRHLAAQRVPGLRRRCRPLQQHDLLGGAGGSRRPDLGH